MKKVKDGCSYEEKTRYVIEFDEYDSDGGYIVDMRDKGHARAQHFTGDIYEARHFKSFKKAEEYAKECQKYILKNPKFRIVTISYVIKEYFDEGNWNVYVSPEEMAKEEELAKKPISLSTIGFQPRKQGTINRTLFEQLVMQAFKAMHDIIPTQQQYDEFWAEYQNNPSEFQWITEHGYNGTNATASNQPALC